MQIKLSTARELGFFGKHTDLYDVETNLFYGVRYLKRALDMCGQVWACALTRYNRGVHAKVPRQITPYAKKAISKSATAWVK